MTSDHTPAAGAERGPAVWSWRREAPLLAIVAAMFVASAVAWPFADDEIPTHWNARGEVDGYGGKLQGLLLLPAVAAGVWLLLAVIPRWDPGRKNYASFGTAYLLTRAGVLAFLALIHAGVIAVAVGSGIDIYFLFPLGIGALLFGLGNVMPKFRPNYFAGVRTPWTLASAKSWTATHRLGGRLFMLGGVLFASMAFIRAEWFVMVLVGGMLAGIAILFIYSYRVWRDDPDRVPVGLVAPFEE